MDRNRLLLGIVLLFTMLFFSLQTAYADEVIFTEDFEDGWGEWYADNGIWEVGVPSDPPGAHGGTQCAGTVLNGNYPNNTDSRLIYDLPHLPGLCLPQVSGDEEIHLRFWHWYSYGDDAGYVQISVQDEVTGDWSAWADIPTSTPILYYSHDWTRKCIDLTAYAGKCIKIAFYHTADGYATYPGWYIDDIEVIKKVPEFTGNFEAGLGDWCAENGIWQVGTPASGPGGGHDSSQCAGTVLNGNYPNHTDSRLISPSFWLPEVSGDEELHFRFWHWIYYGDDYGKLQISVQDGSSGNWSAWADIPTSAPIYYYSHWSPKSVDITAYAGQKVRIAFYHIADGYATYSGWYIDDIEVIKKVPELTVDFEIGWGDWYSDNGVWEVGVPSDPPGAHGGMQCAGTVLNGNYPNHTDSRLISPTIWLPPDCCEVVYMIYSHWWLYGDDHGKVQVSVQDELTGDWSAWKDPAISIPKIIQGTSSVWTQGIVYLTEYVGKKIRVAFYHIADGSATYPGWYIDDIQFPGISPVIDSISFTKYILPPLCSTSTITVTAHDLCEGNLTYNWNAPDGGEIVGTGAEVEFVPPEEEGEESKSYRVTVSVTSDRTHISSFVKAIKIYTEVAYDHDEDDDIDGSDLADFAANYDSEVDDLAGFAEEFGMVACQ